jgi:hypothetical protein
MQSECDSILLSTLFMIHTSLNVVTQICLHFVISIGSIGLLKCWLFITVNLCLLQGMLVPLFSFPNLHFLNNEKVTLRSHPNLEAWQLCNSSFVVQMKVYEALNTS